MTADLDLSPEAVERLARDLDNWSTNAEADRDMEMQDAKHTGERPDMQPVLVEVDLHECRAAAATIRALAAKNALFLDEVDLLTAENEKRTADLAEMTRRRDEWREKAAGHDALRAAVRAGIEQAGDRNLSRVFLRGALAESEKSLAEAVAENASLRAERDAAWQAGAEAMRAASISATDDLIEATREDDGLRERREGLRDAADAIRALPLPGQPKEVA